MKVKYNRCCLCGRYFVGFGNNAQPLAQGRCCNECNIAKVIPARVEELADRQKEVER